MSIEPNNKPMTKRERLLAVLRGEKPDRIPFIDRMNLWYGSRLYKKTMPERYHGMSLQEIHKDIGMGQSMFGGPHGYRLRGVEMVATFNGSQTVYHDTDPLVQWFPGGWAPKFVARDAPGETVVELKTPVGNLSFIWGVTEEMLPQGGLDPYPKKHLITGEEDWPALKWIMERIEFVRLYEDFYALDEGLGPNGFVIPVVNRIPFQQILLEYLGEIPTFYTIYDNPRFLQNLIDLVDERLTDDLHQLADFDFPYIELPDNLDSMMTNPELFQKFNLPAYHKYADILHSQGKLIGSHTDGNLRRLLGLLVESGLDICESIAPAPLTEFTFDELWDAWGENGPIIWGAIPSLLLEEDYTQQQLADFVYNILERVGNKPIILGISDMVVGHNLIERVRWIADTVEQHIIPDKTGQVDYTPIVEVVAPAAEATLAQPASEPFSHDDEILDGLYDNVLDGKQDEMAELTQQGLTLGMEPMELVFEALIPALEEVGRLFETGKIFVPEMLISARAVGVSMSILRPIIVESGVEPVGKFVIGTVKGDIHDIGKNLCITMLTGAGFDVIDLGVNVPPETFVETILEHRPQAIGLSAFLTTTMPMFKPTIGAIAAAGMRDDVKILVGGAPINQEFADLVGADGYAPDASSTVRLTKQLLGVNAKE